MNPKVASKNGVSICQHNPFILINIHTFFIEYVSVLTGHVYLITEKLSLLEFDFTSTNHKVFVDVL